MYYHIQYLFFFLTSFLFQEWWGGRLLDFSKILPETKSKRSSSQCTLVFFPPMSEVKRNVQKVLVPLQGRKRKRKSDINYWKCYFRRTSHCCASVRVCFPNLSHSQRMVPVSLHLSFLAVLLHFLLQFLLLLRRAVLLLAGLPAPLPLWDKTLLQSLHSQ